MMNKIKANDIRITDSFWSKYIKLIRNQIIPYQWEVLNDRIKGIEKSGVIENYKIAAGKKKGDFYGYVFQDSDLAKYLEAVAYSLATYRDKKLEKIADEVIDLIGLAQQDDGYLNTRFTISEREKRYTNLRKNHELYVSGHMIEAAVAYYETTGKTKFLEIMCKNADHLCDTFGLEEGKIPGYPGHQEIELALVKLYEVTKEHKYLDLAKYFIDQRGEKPYYFNIEKAMRDQEDEYDLEFKDKIHEYLQAHIPVAKQRVATGHAVRAVYMYSAVADLAVRYKDKELENACKELWKNVTRKQMHITGGIGSQSHWEGFSLDYDLPNDTSYNETCASIGLVFWARRMNQFGLDSDYDDILEQSLYNGVLSGISLDGKKYFYVNPLQVEPEIAKNRFDQQHVKPTRQDWFGCACCPPNIARLIASIGEYIYSYDENSLAIHQYISNETHTKINGLETDIKISGNYLEDGKVKINFSHKQNRNLSLKLRKPNWCKEASIKLNGKRISSECEKGYYIIKKVGNCENLIEIDFSIESKFIYASPKIQNDSGKVAIKRGPFVYCLEEIDNGKLINSILLSDNSTFTQSTKPELPEGVTVLKINGYREKDNWDDVLYKNEAPKKEEFLVEAIPYYLWNNRGEGEMLVWIRKC